METSLKYPPFPIRLKKQGKQTLVFDPVRKNWLVLTPEEWVRQHLMNFLMEQKGFPISVLSVEKQITLNGQTKRYDLVVYKNMLPLLVVECKAPFVELKTEVIEQAQRYNLILKAPFLMLSNGVSDIIFSKNQRIEDLPQYNEL